MDPTIAPAVQLYAGSTNLFQKALDGLDREALLVRCGENSNPLIWIAGHLTYYRCELASLLGMQREMPWSNLFVRGSTIGDLSSYPEIAEIQTIWTGVSASLMRRFEEITEVQLSAPSLRKIPIPDKTIRGAIIFFAWHESYHIGQMAYVRKWLGYGGLVG